MRAANLILAHLLVAGLLHAQGSPRLPDSLEPTAVLNWAARIDTAAARDPSRTVGFAWLPDGLVTVHDSTDWPTESDLEILVYSDSAGLVRRHMAPSGESERRLEPGLDPLLR